MSVCDADCVGQSGTMQDNAAWTAWDRTECKEMHEEQHGTGWNAGQCGMDGMGQGGMQDNAAWTAWDRTECKEMHEEQHVTGRNAGKCGTVRYRKMLYRQMRKMRTDRCEAMLHGLMVADNDKVISYKEIR